MANGKHNHPAQWAAITHLVARVDSLPGGADSDNLSARVAALESAPLPPATAGGDPGIVDVDTFTGATFDDQLAAALAHARAQTHKPTIRLPHGARTWTRTVEAFTGMKITGAGGGVAVEQPRSGNPYATLIDFKGTDPGRPMIAWPAGQTFGTFIGHMAISGTSSSTLFGAASGSAVAWRAVFRDLGMANMRHAIGTPALKFLMTACTFDGDWNINNARGDAVTVGGSDNALWLGGTCLMDSPTNLNGGVTAHLTCSWLEKTTIGGLYVTAEGAPLGIRVRGGANTEHLVISGARVEGRNAGKPAAGSVVRVEGGDVTLRDCWLGYALGSTVDVLGGDVLIDGATFGRANGSSAPDVAHSGGVLRVTNARRSPLVVSTGGKFTHDGTPRGV